LNNRGATGSPKDLELNWLAKMTDAFRVGKLARNRRTKWWPEHNVLAHAVVIGTLLAGYLIFGLLIRGVPRWLGALGVSPSGINLFLGTAWCGLGMWGIRTQRGYGMGLILMYTLCLLSGLLALAKAFAFI